jgi:hypothetical protein
MPIRTGLLCVFLACVPLRAQDAHTLDAADEIKQAFRRHRFDPSIINAPFDRWQVDPLIIQMEWTGVRGHVESALMSLNVSKKPIRLPCQFRPLPAWDDDKGKIPHRLIPVFGFEKGNVRAKAALKLALGLRDDALWDYEPGQGFVKEVWQTTSLARIGDFKSEFRRDGRLDLIDVHKGLLEVLDDKSLKHLHIQSLPARINRNGLDFTTVWITCCKTKFIAYAWRFKVILERHPAQVDTWELISKVEIGNRFASQLGFRVVADSMKGDFLAEHISVGKSGTMHGDTVRHEVMKPLPATSESARPAGPVKTVTAEEASNLEGLVPLFGDLCRKKLLDAPEVKP